MKTELTFLIELPWQQTTYEPLKKISLFYKWEGGKGTWIFRMKDIKQVELIIGKPVLIPEYRDQFNKELVIMPKFKGKDFIELKEFPKIYQIIEHRKTEDAQGEFKVKDIKHEIPRALVDEIYKSVISVMPLNKAIKTATVSENICTLLALKRFFRDGTGTFDFEKFYGERKDYYTYFYLPMKVLQHQGKIIHHKDGKVERIV